MGAVVWLCSMSLPISAANNHVNLFINWSIFNGAGFVVVVGIVLAGMSRVEWCVEHVLSTSVGRLVAMRVCYMWFISGSIFTHRLLQYCGSNLFNIRHSYLTRSKQSLCFMPLVFDSQFWRYCAICPTCRFQLPTHMSTISSFSRFLMGRALLLLLASCRQACPESIDVSNVYCALSLYVVVEAIEMLILVHRGHYATDQRWSKLLSYWSHFFDLFFAVKNHYCIDEKDKFWTWYASLLICTIAEID